MSASSKKPPVPPKDPPRDKPLGDGPYVVQPGDCIDSIAYEHGLFWKTVWDDPANAALKQKRKDPNLLLPGDRLTITGLREREESSATEARARFRRKGVPAKLRLCILAAGKPRSGQPFAADIDGHIQEGQTDGDGVLELTIPNNARKGKLRVGEGKDLVVYDLDLGRLPPCDTISGAQARLNNLGFEAGEVDGSLGPNTRDALKRFQAFSKLEETGELDQATCDKLKKAHGS